MGFKEHMIECSDKPLTLKGYGGDNRQQRANIRIKGSGWGRNCNYVGGASNDLGWELQEDGTYAFHVSDYDRHRYGTKWQKQLLQQYGKAVIHEVVEDQGMCIEEEEEVNGELHITVGSQF